ncbi:MAG: magnesium transporter, partial [Muribaculaceae bacterium]|nr:magnesium transporter [Muribaculaceae bacterium]
VAANDTVFAQTKARIPWLLIGIASGILASLILTGFENQLAAVTALALFIPIIGGTGGNVGVQASAIVVQGLANGSLDIKQFGAQLGKEVLIGLLNATVLSLVIFVYNLIMLPHDFAVTISVAVSLWAVVMFATILGTVVPLTLEKLKINPALATGPFIQISNDIVGLILYVNIATWFLKHLG